MWKMARLDWNDCVLTFESWLCWFFKTRDVSVNRERTFHRFWAKNAVPKSKPARNLVNKYRENSGFVVSELVTGSREQDNVLKISCVHNFSYQVCTKFSEYNVAHLCMLKTHTIPKSKKMKNKNSLCKYVLLRRSCYHYLKA